MKFFVAILALAAVASADVAHLVRSPEADAEILRYDNQVEPESFQVAFQTSNGIEAQEVGQLKVIGPEEQAIVVQGENAHTAPNGETFRLTYVANEFGYQPQGAHLPTPPPPQPIPDYILRALEFIAAHPHPVEKLSKV